MDPTLPTTFRAIAFLRLILLGTASITLLAASPGGGVFAGSWKAAGTDTSERVTVSYHAEKLGEGRISMKLGPEGERFVGQYLRLDGTRPEGRVRLIYRNWASEGFDSFRYGPSGAAWGREEVTFEIFRKRYSGAVVATLIGDRGSSMRCQLSLEDVTRGLPGGAAGLCQATSGDVVTIRSQRPGDPR